MYLLERLDRPEKKLLTVATSRNIEIPAIISAGTVYRPPIPWKTEQMRVVTNYFVDGFPDIRGLDNLVRAVRLSEKNKLTVESNHETDLDHAGKRLILEALGFREFAYRLVYATGLKMVERWFINYFMGAEHTVFIGTPGDVDAVSGALAKARKEPLLTKAEKSTLETYRDNLNFLNQAAMNCFADLERQGFVTALYPEATRSRHPKSFIQRAPKSVALYTYQRDGDTEGFILPMSADGLNKVLPPEKLIKFWKWKGVRLKVVFGEPFPASEIWDRRRVRALKEMRAEKADYMMAKIAVLNPDLVDPQDMEFYKRVLVA